MLMKSAGWERLELLELVAQGPRSVEALAERCGLSIANASQHLQHLRRAGLVVTRRDGKFVLYALSDDASRSWGRYGRVDDAASVRGHPIVAHRDPAGCGAARARAMPTQCTTVGAGWRCLEPVEWERLT